MNWKPVIAAWLAWLGSFSFLYAVDGNVGLSWQIKQLMFVVIPVRNPYGFWSLFFPRMLAFLVISMPPTWLGLLVYELRGRFRLWHVVAMLTAMCIVWSLVRVEIEDVRAGWPALVLLALVALSNLPLLWLLRRAILLRRRCEATQSMP